MNKPVNISFIALIITSLLFFSNSVISATIDTGSGGATGSGGSSGGGETTPKKSTLELVMTVIKNEKLEVTGNLFGGAEGANISLKLNDSPAGNYGYLDISADGAFRYAIKNDLPQVQALGLNDLATDIFHYQFTDSNSFTVNGTLTIYILGNPSVSYDNVEIEFNNTSATATALHAGSSSQLGQYMRGQLTTSSDRDWYVLNSLGNEIISLELCPEGSQCVDEKAWVMYVFDADELKAQKDESETFTLYRYVQQTGEILDSVAADHMYLLLNKEKFAKSLIGLIDPCFGDKRTLDIGVGEEAKTYYVAIATPLVRKDPGEPCGSGDVVREQEIPLGANNTIIQEYLTAQYSDDQYFFRVTRTGADPFAIIQSSNSTFDSSGKVVNVPQMRINDQLYSLNLKQLNNVSNNDIMTFNLESYDLLNTPLTSDPYLPTYNPANNIVKIPQVVVDGGAAYTVELLYLPASNTLQVLRAIPLNQ